MWHVTHLATETGQQKENSGGGGGTKFEKKGGGGVGNRWGLLIK